MDGFIVLNKEKNYTSHDYVNKIRKIFNTKKVGHLGTLDPMATGVLIIAINDATKLISFLEDSNKSYLATVSLGFLTDTLDSEGVVIQEKKLPSFQLDAIDNALETFVGDSLQFPPIYSAIKINGRKLYEYARKNIEVQIPARKISIFSIKRESNLFDVNGYPSFTFSVTVSKGTYVRSLCRDIGEKLGTFGTMIDLVRTSQGGLDLNLAKTIQQILDGDFKLISMIDALGDISKIYADDCIKKAKNGMKISSRQIYELLNDNPQRIAIINDEKLLAIYELTISEDQTYYKAARVWN